MKIVAIGASAGGIDAISELLNALPTDTGASFVIVQHLSPKVKSIMDELLAKHTSMPFHVVSEATRPEPNHLYLIPHDQNLVFEAGILRLQPRGNRRLNLPIDLFFNSLGQELEHHAIAVILSGSGTDGSRGARTIKEKGGIVLVQDPSTAQFDGMPQAILRLGLADDTLAPADLAGRLGFLLSDDHAPAKAFSEEQAPSAFEEILELVGRRTGLKLAQYRESTLRRRTEKRMLLNRKQTLGEYLEYLRVDSSEVDKLVRDFLIGVTRFFRDPDVFECLYDHVLPKILAPEGKGQVRIWVPGCSTGEEAYSIAFLIEELQARSRNSREYKIFASDVDRRAIDLASQGQYPQSTMADVPEAYLEKYFIRNGDSYEVISTVRDRILFAVQDVLQDPPFIRMDLISCRNLLIYLKPEAQRKILTTFHFALQPDSFLVLGPSESLGELRNAYIPHDGKLNVFVKREDAEMVIRPTYRTKPKSEAIAQSERQAALRPGQQKPDLFEPSRPWASEGDAFGEALLETYAPRGILVDDELQVYYISGDLADFLSLPKARARLNVFRMMDEAQANLVESGVRIALNENTPKTFHHVALGQQVVHLIFRPVVVNDPDHPLVFVEIHTPEKAGDQDEPPTVSIDPKLIEQEQIRILRNELRQSRLKAQNLVGELEATNEELQSSNRELMASNEELQSTNEELQSVNEELHTVNSELQAKNAELITSNNDISNLLRSIDIGTIFLDSDLRIRRFTPAIKGAVDLVEADIGRPITNFSTTLVDFDLQAVCEAVFESLQPYEEQVKDERGSNFLVRVLPYRTLENAIRGLVLTLINVDELAEARNQLENRVAEFEAFMDQAQHQIFLVDQEGRIQRINQAKYSGLNPKAIEKQLMTDFVHEDDRAPLQNALAMIFDGKPIVKVEVRPKGLQDENQRVVLVGTPVMIQGMVKYVAFISSDAAPVDQSSA